MLVMVYSSELWVQSLGSEFWESIEDAAYYG
jgi:hypothetical protein